MNYKKLNEDITDALTYSLEALNIAGNKTCIPKEEKTATEIVKETEEYRRILFCNRALAEERLKELNNVKD